MQFAQHPPFFARSSIDWETGRTELRLLWSGDCRGLAIRLLHFWWIHPSQLFSKGFCSTNKLHEKSCVDCVEYPWNPHRMLQKIAPKQSCIALLKRDLTHLGWRGRLTETYRNDYWRGTERPKKRMFLSHDAFIWGKLTFFGCQHFPFGAGSRWRDLPLADTFCRLPMYWDGNNDMNWIWKNKRCNNFI